MHIDEFKLAVEERSKKRRRDVARFLLYGIAYGSLATCSMFMAYTMTVVAIYGGIYIYGNPFVVLVEAILGWIAVLAVIGLFIKQWR